MRLQYGLAQHELDELGARCEHGKPMAVARRRDPSRIAGEVGIEHLSRPGIGRVDPHEAMLPGFRIDDRGVIDGESGRPGKLVDDAAARAALRSIRQMLPAALRCRRSSCQPSGGLAADPFAT